MFVARIIDLLTDGMVDLFVFQSTDRTVQYKLNAQSLRLFSLHDDVNDAHRAGANRLFSHFPKDRNCEICQRTKKQGPCAEDALAEPYLVQKILVN